MALSRRALLHTGALGIGAWSWAESFNPARADTSVSYDGPGLYLYPRWGQPRLYLIVTAAEGGQGVEFRDPVSSAVLWTQSLALCGDFAGKLS